MKKISTKLYQYSNDKGEWEMTVGRERQQPGIQRFDGDDKNI